MNKNLITLKAKIKGLAQSGAKSKEMIRATSKDSKDYHWNMKRFIGYEARYHLLAYGLLRGKQYKDIEPHADRSKLLSLDYGYLAQICQRHCNHLELSKFTPANLSKMILGWQNG